MSGSGSAAVMPASFGQERLWFFDQLAGGAPLYNVHFAFMLDGPLDPAAFANAVQLVVARHEVLRTSLQSVDGVPHQVIAAQVELPLPVIDLSHVPVSQHHDEALRQAAEHAAAPIPLDAPPLLRTTLLRFGPQRHVWLLTLHHGIFDGASAGVFFEELSEAYQARRSGRYPEWTDLALQYADYAVWQRELVDGGLAEQREYWTRQLAGAPTLLDLPTDHPRPATDSHQGALRELTLPDELRTSASALARRERVTEFMALLAAFLVLLHRWGAGTDLVVGTVVAGRDRVELERLIGFCSNTVALRVPVSPRLPFADLLARVRECVAGAQSHADLPFDQVVDSVRPDRQPGVNPLFQVMFDVQPGGHDRLQLDGVRASPLRVRDRRVSLFDLSCSVETGTEVRLVAEYRTDLFRPETIDQFLASYRAVLQQLVDEPARAVGQVRLLDPAARAAAVARLRREEVAAPHPTVTASIAGWVSRQASAPAVLDAATGHRLSYGELWRWSGAIADQLHRRRIGGGGLVALLAPRSPAAIAAVLGVLRAGAAYLPLDPLLPDARLAELLDGAAPDAVLVVADDPQLAARADRLGGTRRLLRSAPEPAAPDDAATAAAPVGPDHPAYVMFTSGSTGRPKGVVVRHGGLANYVAADRDRYRLTPHDRVLQFTSLSFDVSAEEIFPCLASGAALVLRSEQMLDTPADFLAACDRWSVTVAHLPTAYFHELAAAVADGATAPPQMLRVAAIGGETPAGPHLVAWHAAAPAVRVENVYGPTEATIASAMATLAAPGTPPDAEGPVPIGGPIPGMAMQLLDAGLEPVPDGVVGEIYLAGAGLAAGYLGDPARTADRFVPHPFGTGARMYRTGDLARMLPGGALEFRGRIDDQVKVRGYRAEPGEAGAALAALASIRQAVVVPCTNPRGETELVGYLVPADPERPPPAEQLRAELGGRLPGYLIPAAFVTIPEVPLTPNDKVDRAALPDPWPAGHLPSTPAPAGDLTATERAVAAVWREVLGVEQIAADADFFGLGGHSLLATRVVSRLREDFGSGVRLNLLFEHPRLSAFAAALDGLGATPATGIGRAGASAGTTMLAELTRDLSDGELAALLRSPDGAAASPTQTDAGPGRGDGGAS